MSDFMDTELAPALLYLAHVRLPATNSLVNKIEFLELIPQVVKTNEIVKLVIITHTALP